MKREHVNPWEWQDEMGYSQAIEVDNGERVLYSAGQTAMDSEVNPVHSGDIRGQTSKALDSIEAVLAEAG